MIGQVALLNKLNSYTLETLPKASILIGECGSGKHTVANNLAAALGLKLVELTNSLSDEELIEYQYGVSPTLYIINISTFSEKQQNQLLKLIEEPSKYMYIILLAESENSIIQTILNRCIKFYFEEYTIDELKQIKLFDNESIYYICKTPGQLLDIDDTNIDKLFNLCTTISKKLQVASFANTLSISTKLNYKEDYDKFNINLFFNALLYISKQEYIKTNSDINFMLYTITKKYKQKLSLPAVNKENLVLSFLCELANICK